MTTTEQAAQARAPDAPISSYFADRVRVYPRSVRGPARTFKWSVLALCLSVYYLMPWLRWDRGEGQPNQAILLDLQHERFHFFNLTFWPQDIYFLTGLLIMAAVTLFLVTSLFGRVWCGYACPQTVWTDLYMLVERTLEGDRNERMKRDSQRLSLDGALRKSVKHLVWLGIAFWTGGAWIMYYVDAPTVTWEFWNGEASTAVYLFTGIFTFTTYTLAGWAREQVCTYMCPWPRFQSAMLDEQSIIVTYQGWRGEPRAHGKRPLEPVQPAKRLGDCIDCNACVNVCPTGVDIRDGIQLGCINCGLCVDACNDVMHRTQQKPWLITWDTLSGQKAKAEGRHEKLRIFRARTFIYLGALLVAMIVMTAAMVMRTDLGLVIEHDRAPLFVRVQDGALRNGYTVKVANKNPTSQAFTLSVDGVPGARVALATEGPGRDFNVVLPVAGDSVGTFRIMVYGDKPAGTPAQIPVTFTLRNSETGATKSYTSYFMGPGT